MKLLYSICRNNNFLEDESIIDDDVINTLVVLRVVCKKKKQIRHIHRGKINKKNEFENIFSHIMGNWHVFCCCRFFFILIYCYEY